MKHLKTMLLSALAVMGLTTQVFAQQILAFKFTSVANDSKLATVASTTTSANLQTSALSRGTGAPANSSAGYTFNANMTYSATKQDAINNGAYFEFFVQAKSGYMVSVTELQAVIRVQQKSADHYRWRYTVDEGQNWTEIGSDVILTGANTNNYDNYGTLQAAIPISGLTNIRANAKIIFRIYAWGGDTQGADYTNTAFSIGKSRLQGPPDTDRNAISIKGSVDTDPVPLPVNLVSFTGKSDGNGINLIWSTASEQNNSYFEVLHSTATGQTPQVIAKLNGKGTTQTFSNYHYTHTNPAYGTNYYQLKQVDVNGNTTLYDPIAIKYTISPSAFALYADKGQLVCNVASLTATNGKLSLVNVNGQVVYQQQVKLAQGQNTIRIPVTANANIYVCSLVTNDGNSLSRKFYIK